MLESAPVISATAVATLLNRDCFCVGTDVPGLRGQFDRVLAEHGVPIAMSQSHPHLFSAAPVFVAARQLRFMQEVIDAIETVIAMPQWQQATLAQAPLIARPLQAARGVFMGYDFHLEGEGARLIEINSNAGGAMLNVALANAQQACCDEMLGQFDSLRDVPAIELRLVDMFREEWRRARGTSPLKLIAIVDTVPQQQYLYPEFLLFQQIFARHGIEVLILDPQQLRLQDDALLYGGRRIDLVYNRLTDFYFEASAHAHLLEAYRSEAAVFTPHPHAHAIYANKHNLELLTDPDMLRSWSVPEATIDILQRGIPRTRNVARMDSASLWQERNRWFFKPATGFGSRGSYRGDKLSRKVFEQILAGDYVAQALVPPSERTTDGGEGEGSHVLKLDLRNYTYEGQVQLVAARLYQGQTTNFRTSGGGFAPVYVVPESGSTLAMPALCGKAGVRGIDFGSKCATPAASN